MTLLQIDPDAEVSHGGWIFRVGAKSLTNGKVLTILGKRLFMHQWKASDVRVGHCSQMYWTLVEFCKYWNSGKGHWHCLCLLRYGEGFLLLRSENYILAKGAAKWFSGRVQSCYDNVSEKQCFDLGFIKICYIKYILYDIYIYHMIWIILRCWGSPKFQSWVWWRADFQSGSRVLKKVFWTFSYLYLWHTMWFHAKKLLKTLKFWKSLNLLCKSGSRPQKSPKKAQKTDHSIAIYSNV